MATKKETAAAGASKVKAAHAATGKPLSPTEDPTKHDVPASAIAGQVDPKGQSGATVNAASIDSLEATADEKEKVELEAADQGLPGKIKRSELYLVNDHSRGGGPYVGISPQNDPKADQASKERSAVTPLGNVAPRTGLQVRMKDGTSFTIGDGFGPDSTPADWAKVTLPSGEPLFK